MNKKTNKYDYKNAKSLNKDFDVVSKATLSKYTYQNFESNISVRPGFERTHYEYFRPEDKIPTDPHGIMSFANSIYKNIGIVHNIINFMTDVAIKGLKVTHPDKKTQKLARKWFAAINGYNRSERFLNNLYKLGNVIIVRHMGRVRKKDLELEKEIRFKIAIKGEYKEPYEILAKPRTGDLPVDYVFVNPLLVDIENINATIFGVKPIYKLNLDTELLNAIRFPRNMDILKALKKMLPVQTIDKIKKGYNNIALNPEHTIVYHYKKDDWEAWGMPITQPIFEDIILLKKMKLADLATLDNMIYQIRIWKLGDIQSGLIPDKQAFDTLENMLLSNTGGGIFDIIWGPDLSVETVQSDIYRFLGSDKYEPIISSIYEGLGIPPSFVASVNTGASSASNSMVALKALLQRLSYGQATLIDFWNKEFEIFANVFKLDVAPTITFDRLIMKDEDSEKRILIQLWDRGLISDETLLEIIGENPEIENTRKLTEESERKQGKRTKKTGPYFPDQAFELTKLLLTRTGQTTKSLIDLLDIDIPELQLDEDGMTIEPTNQPGRPKGSKDKKKRKEKKDTIPDFTKTVSNILNKKKWATSHIEKIREQLLPSFLSVCNKKSYKHLSNKEKVAFDNWVWETLCSINPFTEYNLKKVVSNKNKENIQAINTITNVLIDKLVKLLDRELNKKELNDIRLTAYAIYHEA